MLLTEEAVYIHSNGLIFVGKSISNSYIEFEIKYAPE